MGPLIEIKTVPIEIEMKTTNAQLLYSRGTAEMEVSREKGGLSIKSRPIKLNVDSFQARSSVRPTTMQSVKQAAQSGKQAAYQATATYAKRGQLVMDAQLGQELITQFAQETQDAQMGRSVEDFGLGFLPEGGIDLNWEPGQMQIRYEMDKLNFDWKTNGMGFQFVPGDIEFTMTQRPEVIIKYVGGAVYVPPSSDPNYQPVDVRA
ncbi:DUF6470 family protein [Acutalibacter caecimuris]|uniref:DUF6470 family protein n=1 Tax=Acutalibacter caecimuris TaxID=3093657 RepID=UPI002AC90274|nr:DUF6470 family protein [Acutalibacter sp. M00118]